VDKGHGRIETRSLWCCPTDPATLGLAGAAQLVRIQRDVQTVRRGKVIKETHEATFPFTSLWPEEIGPDQLQELTRDHWSIENGQHHRRDRTQDEDRCTVRETNSARNLSLFRSLVIFLCEAQPPRKGTKRSLPDFQRQVCRQPWGLIRRFMPKPSTG
jgi:predicted transposase YbfD/YdcC